jgi:hypothetical protein
MSLYIQPDGTHLGSDQQVEKLTRELAEAKKMLRIVAEMMRHSDACYEHTGGCICGVLAAWKSSMRILTP